MKDDQLSHKLIENGAKTVDQLPLMPLFSLPFVKKEEAWSFSGSLEWHNTSSLVGGTPSNNTSRIAVKIVVLEALEALLAVGDALKSEGWRSDVHLLLINIATNSQKGGWAGRNYTSLITLDYSYGKTTKE
ncbi:proline- glutamic acid- and leucine-rich protein 1-like isoform X3 [Prunus yedoensis var. nudiflora]|uniref:Proline-glutamic acid-and leucine-rich protein 1-like isoform X3 n=1 Tax=Prunus yedoensis var. nudiflora TaxID=2094558 RepID=A0A314XM12_PRUYE|nr:proline- glutamic acid- and leucine-rich protein 1-like isoform X3 [Prunus yedoensis var. nudiflora]